MSDVEKAIRSQTGITTAILISATGSPGVLAWRAPSERRSGLVMKQGSGYMVTES
jgi:hypothetical protein